MTYAMTSGSVVANETNWDDITRTGCYRFNTPNEGTNAPPIQWGQLLVVHASGDTIAQIAFNYSDDVGTFYVRGGNPPSCGGVGIWRKWARFSGTTI